MKEISIKLKNCYGIGQLEYVFDYSKVNTFLIYAPNGTMKTSIAKTFRYFASENAKEPCDQIYTARKSKFELAIDGAPVIPPDDRILVIDPELINYDGSHRISNFIASKDLKDQFDLIYSDLDTRKNDFIKKLKITSQSSDCESEIISTFGEKENDNFFDVLDRIHLKLEEDNEKYDFRYNDIFDKKGNVKKFLEKNQKDLDVYIEKYDSLISKSKFFKKSNNSFGTFQANEILKSVEDESFFEAGHTLLLNDAVEINKSETLKELVEAEIRKVVDDKDLKKTFDKIDKAIGGNVELRAFKTAIEKNNLLLVELKDYEAFKKKTWLGYLNELKVEILELYAFYASKKQELEILVAKAKEEFEIWNNLVNQFNARFHVPFSVELLNQEDIILKKDLAVLKFHYDDKRGDLIQPEKDLLFNEVLSRGEKRAFYILQILFDIESKKVSGKQTFVVFDDIADSFDYKNKFAIIEYIKDLADSGLFKILVLTHNFDFYRTVASRLNLPRNKEINSVLMVSKKDNGEISLNKGQYVNDLFAHFLDRITDERVFISMIPFLRNIIEYTEGDKSHEYELLTKCLHKKKDSEKVLINDILSIWSQRFPKHQPKFQKITFGAQSVIDVIYNTAESIIAKQIDDETPLENKISLSIAIRLKAEEFMIANINGLNLEEIKSNQTQELFSLYKKSAAADKNKIKILDKVVLMTPENIHLNSFMYEPLIDISLWHLIELYKEVKTL